MLIFYPNDVEKTYQITCFTASIFESLLFRMDNYTSSTLERKTPPLFIYLCNKSNIFHSIIMFLSYNVAIDNGSNKEYMP